MRRMVLTRHELPAILSITLGTLFYAYGIMAIIRPIRLPDAGLTGIALLSHYLFHISPAWVVAGGNLLLMKWSWGHFSPRFTILSSYSILLLTLSLSLMEHLPPLDLPDIFLMTILGGFCKGLGIGLIFRVGASQGGIDIIVMALRRRYGVEIGQYSFYINFLILCFSGFFLGLRGTIYGAVSVYVAGLVIDQVLHAYDRRKQVLVITKAHEATRSFIIHQLRQGVTLLQAQGGYSLQPMPVLLSLLSMRQGVLLKQFLAEIDPHAFMAVSDATEVLGHGFKDWKRL